LDNVMMETKPALMLCAARLRYVAGSRWGRKRYLDMDLLKDQELEEQLEAAIA